MNSDILQSVKKRLEAEREKLMADLSSIAERDPSMKHDWDAKMPQFEPVESGSHASLEEEADEVEEYESRLGVEHSLESRLMEVNRGLERMEKEGYGICAKCGKEIPVERLEANPAAEFCITHAS